MRRSVIKHHYNHCMMISFLSSIKFRFRIGRYFQSSDNTSIKHTSSRTSRSSMSAVGINPTALKRGRPIISESYDACTYLSLKAVWGGGQTTQGGGGGSV